MTGQSVGSDASRLSCFLFRPRKSREKRRKRSYINVSSTLSTRSSTPPAQTAHVRFHERKRVHTRLSEKDRTQGLTRRNTGLPDGAAITTLGAFCAVRKPCAAGYQNGKLCRFWVLAGCAPEERRKPSEQRCAHARRCSEGVAAPLGRVIFLLLSKLRLVCPVPDTSFGSPDVPACAVPVQAASQLGSFRLGVQWFSVETGRIFCYNFGKRVT